MVGERKESQQDESQLILASTVQKVIVSQYMFFFQAEDGIRDYKVTGVQTCALPISRRAIAVAVPAWAEHRQRVGHHRPPLPGRRGRRRGVRGIAADAAGRRACSGERDRKSTRLNSSHLVISYAVFCLKKKHTRRESRLRPHPSPLPRRRRGLT